MRKKLLAMLLAGMIVLAGCSRPAADTPVENDDPAPEQQEQQEEQEQLQRQDLRRICGKIFFIKSKNFLLKTLTIFPHPVW